MTGAGHKHGLREQRILRQACRRPFDPGAISNRPPLPAPGTGSEGFASLNGYRLRPGAEFPRGQIIPNNGGRDFFGNPVPADRAPRIGACEGSHEPLPERGRPRPRECFRMKLRTWPSALQLRGIQDLNAGASAKEDCRSTPTSRKEM